MFLLRPRSLALAAVVALAGGCASQNAELRRDLADVKRELVQLRAQNLALRERVDSLELTAPPSRVSGADAESAAEAEEAKPAAPESDRPKLAVVRVGPDEASDGWTLIDPSDLKRPRVAQAPPQDGVPAAVIHSDRAGNVIQEPARPQLGRPQR